MFNGIRGEPGKTALNQSLRAGQASRETDERQQRDRRLVILLVEAHPSGGSVQIKIPSIYLFSKIRVAKNASNLSEYLLLIQRRLF